MCHEEEAARERRGSGTGNEEREKMSIELCIEECVRIGKDGSGGRNETGAEKLSKRGRTKG